LDYNFDGIVAVITFARMAEQADALDLGSSPEQGWGFNSPSSHIEEKNLWNIEY
jgi:hypothetical protein